MIVAGPKHRAERDLSDVGHALFVDHLVEAEDRDHPKQGCAENNEGS